MQLALLLTILHTTGKIVNKQALSAEYSQSWLQNATALYLS